MRGRILILLIVLAPLLAAQDPTRELMHKAIANYEKSQRLLGFFLFERRVETRHFHANGEIKERKNLRIERCLVEDLPVNRLVERDGKPLPPAEVAKQDENIRKTIDEFRKLELDAQRKRIEGASGQGREVEFLREMPEALDYRYLASQWEEGREVLEFAFGPRDQYKPSNTQARVFTKVRGRIWIDKAEAEIRKVDAEVFDNVSIGGFLANLYKGTRFQTERQRYAAEAWLPIHLKVRYGVKIMAVKNVRRETETAYFGFRPWRLDLIAPVTGSR